MTEDQRTAFGFSGTNQTYSEIVKFLQSLQNTLVLQAISSSTQGEDRIHLCGQAEGINYALSAIIDMRNQALHMNGLTPDRTEQ
jgi:hypothetical protein